MDALVMDGRTLASGAVSAVRNIANPTQLARLVMDKVWGWPTRKCFEATSPGQFHAVSFFQTSHACLTAEGAGRFARSMGIPEVSQEYARMRWRKNLAPDANPVECQM